MKNKLLNQKLLEVEVEESRIDDIVREAVNIALKLQFPTKDINELRSQYKIIVTMAELETKAVLQAEVDRKRRFLMKMIG